MSWKIVYSMLAFALFVRLLHLLREIITIITSFRKEAQNNRSA